MTWGAAAKALGVDFFFLGLGIPRSVLEGIFQSHFGHLGFLFQTSRLQLKYFLTHWAPLAKARVQEVFGEHSQAQTGMAGGVLYRARSWTQ